MSSADIMATITTKTAEKAKLEELKTTLSGKEIEKTPVRQERNTDSMAGTRYKEQHEAVKEVIKTFTGQVSDEKEDALDKLQTKIGSLTDEIDQLNREYDNAVTSEKAAADAEKKRKEDEAKKKSK